LKITLISEAVWPERKGGLERWFDAISQFLVSCGYEVTFLNSSSVTEERNGTKFQSVLDNPWQYVGEGKRSKLQALNFGVSIFNWLRKQDKQVIFCSSVPIISVLAAALAPKKSLVVEWFEIWTLKYWIRYSGFFVGLIGWSVQLIALQVGDYRLVYSDRAFKSVNRWGKLNKRMVIKMPGLCPKEIPLYNSPNEKWREDFYFLGRFVAEKQPFIAIDAAQSLRRNGWSGRLWLMGTGPLCVDLLKYIEAQNLQDFVILIENPNDEEVKRVMAKSCALLHPSRREGFGLAPVEAAYFGLPTIMIDYPDNAAIELEICSELTAQSESIEEIVSKMNLALRHQDRYRIEVLEWSKSARVNRNFFSTLQKIDAIIQSEFN